MLDLTIELREEQTQAIAGLPYLTLQLDRHTTVALQLKFVRETLVLPAERFMQMPNVDPCLIGLVEHRSNVFWVLDLPQLLGFSSVDTAISDTHIAILQTGNMFLGLGTYRIGRVKRIIDADIRSPTSDSLPPEMIPFLRGWVDDDQKIYILDASAIAKLDFSQSNNQ